MGRVTRKDLFSSVWILMLWGGISAYNLDTKFPVIYNNTPGSYFGFTVALHRNKDGPIALVGAPKSNASFPLHDIHQPGVLFRCGIPTRSTEAKCDEVLLDKEGNTESRQGGFEYSYRDRKDDMWLGVSLDVQQGSSQNDVVTCGHLWKNQLYPTLYLANGACYVINSELDPNSVRKLVPLVEKSKQIYGQGIYYYIFGQAGISATYSEDGKYLLLGAPGIYDWQGNVISYPAELKTSNYIYKNPVVPYQPGYLTYESYFGYSSTSGRFFDTTDVFFAVGAPRFKDHGGVFIFKALDQRTREFFVQEQKEGTQLNEYFGASLLGVNLNGDSYTDLLVGAPLFSSDFGGDEGKVYVYLSNGQGLQLYAELMGGSKPSARFGTAAANIGDLNQDGYNDVAIGAPYEDGKGAVYIYHGSKTGMNTWYVQKFEAKTISPKLSGFGIHIARGLDIDNNKYPDILVGAYTSSNAVLFRSRPVVHLYPKLIFDPSQINTNVTNCEFQGEKLPCVNVSACLWYVGKKVPRSQGFRHEIFVDHSETNLVAPRGFFAKNGKKVTVIRDNTNLNIEKEQCIKRVLYIQPDIYDAITPVQILFRYSLMPPVNADKYFDKSYPIADPSSLTNITSSITFVTGCLKEDECFSNLIISAEIIGTSRNGYFTLGNTSDVSLSITVINKGEPAYLSELLIYLPQDMPSINQDFCSGPRQLSNASLICDLGNPLLEDREVKILIKLDATKIPTNLKMVDIYLEAVTVSTETAPEDNKKKVSLYPQAIADIGITGVSSQEQIIYDETEKFNVSITHTYTIRNHGPSGLQVIDIMLYVPRKFINSDGHTQFLSLSKVESGKLLTIPTKCNNTFLNFETTMPNIKHNEVIGEDDLIVPAKENGAESLHTVSRAGNAKWSNLTMHYEENLERRTKRSVEKNQKTPFRSREIIKINCNNESIECIAIQCSASPFAEIRKFAQISITFQVDVTGLSNSLGPWYRLELTTMGFVMTRDVNVEFLHHHQNVTEVETMFVRKSPPPPEELAPWIIFFGIGIGVLLLLIILILLIRFGFFKRKQKEKMKEMQNEVKKRYSHLDEEPAENNAIDEIKAE